MSLRPDDRGKRRTPSPVFERFKVVETQKAGVDKRHPQPGPGGRHEIGMFSLFASLSVWVELVARVRMYVKVV